MTKDELTPSSFERAVNNALQKSALIGEVQVQTFARAEVERVLNLFANQCVTDIKPLVSRLIRQLRDIRETPGGNVDQAHQRHERAEASCLHLLDFLKDMEKQHAGVMMKDLFANASYPAKAFGQPLSGVSAAKRPPSPFSRRTH